MTNPILTLLQEASVRLERVERKIAEAERERTEARIEIAAYERAAHALGLSIDASLPNAGATEALTAKRTRSAKALAPQSEWARVFQLLYKQHKDGFGYDEIAIAADEIGVAYQRPSLRTKMMNYVNDSAMERVGNGKFRISDHGKSVFQIDVVLNENGEASASSDADEDAASSLI